jgi:hypothetical protein
MSIALGRFRSYYRRAKMAAGNGDGQPVSRYFRTFTADFDHFSSLVRLIC